MQADGQGLSDKPLEGESRKLIKSKAAMERDNVQEWCDMINSPQSWAVEVESETERAKRGGNYTPRVSIWDEFDIINIINTRFKLDYVRPKKAGEDIIVEIEEEGIRT